MPDVSVAILGLGRIGASVALALKRYNARGGNNQFHVVGYDSRNNIAKHASKEKLTDEMANKLYHAVPGKAIVVMALPYADVRYAYEAIKDDLQSGAVIIDMSPLKIPSLEWAKQNLPDTVHLVGVTPVINPAYLFEAVDTVSHAHEDLFDNGSMLLMPGADCIKQAVELAVDFSTILGAEPHFVDAAEHDSLMAAVDEIPSLLGVALFYAQSRGFGWGDAQRMTNPAFAALTHHLFDTHPDDLRDTWLNNRDNLVRALDDLSETLDRLRTALAENDQETIEGAIVQSSEEYEHWYNRRLSGKWDEEANKKVLPNAITTISQNLMGSYMADRLRNKEDD